MKTHCPLIARCIGVIKSAAAQQLCLCFGTCGATPRADATHTKGETRDALRVSLSLLLERRRAHDGKSALHGWGVAATHTHRSEREKAPTVKERSIARQTHRGSIQCGTGTNQSAQIVIIINQRGIQQGSKPAFTHVLLLGSQTDASVSNEHTLQHVHAYHSAAAPPRSLLRLLSQTYLSSSTASL